MFSRRASQDIEQSKPGHCRPVQHQIYRIVTHRRTHRRRLTKRSAMVSGQSGARGGNRRLPAARRGRLPDGYRLAASWGVHQNWRKSAATCLIRARPAPSGSSRPPERTTRAEPEPWPPYDRRPLNRMPPRPGVRLPRGRALWAGGPMLAWGPRTSTRSGCRLRRRPGDRRGTPASGALPRLAAPGLEPVFAAARMHSQPLAHGNAEQTRRTAAAISGGPFGRTDRLPGIAGQAKYHHENRIHRTAQPCCLAPARCRQASDKLSLRILDLPLREMA
jgi:hypothetical protein